MGGWLQYFDNPKHERAAALHTIQTLAIEVREGQAELLGKMTEGAAASFGIAAVLCEGGAGGGLRPTSRQNLEKIYPSRFPPEATGYGTPIQVRYVPEIRFAVSRSRNADRRFQTDKCMVKTGQRVLTLDAESNKVQIYPEVLISGVVARFRNTETAQTHRSAVTHYRPWRSRCARVKPAAARQMAQGAVASLRITAVLLRMCAGGKFRPILETRDEIWGGNTFPISA